MPALSKNKAILEKVTISFLNNFNGNTGDFTFVSVIMKANKPMIVNANKLRICHDVQAYSSPPRLKANNKPTIVIVKNAEPTSSIDSPSRRGTFANNMAIIIKATPPSGRKIQNTQFQLK